LWVYNYEYENSLKFKKSKKEATYERFLSSMKQIKTKYVSVGLSQDLRWWYIDHWSTKLVDIGNILAELTFLVAEIVLQNVNNKVILPFDSVHFNYSLSNILNYHYED